MRHGESYPLGIWVPVAWPPDGFPSLSEQRLPFEVVVWFEWSLSPELKGKITQENSLPTFDGVNMSKKWFSAMFPWKSSPLMCFQRANCAVVHNPKLIVRIGLRAMPSAQLHMSWLKRCRLGWFQPWGLWNLGDCGTKTGIWIFFGSVMICQYFRSYKPPSMDSQWWRCQIYRLFYSCWWCEQKGSGFTSILVADLTISDEQRRTRSVTIACLWRFRKLLGFAGNNLLVLSREWGNDPW